MDKQTIALYSNHVVEDLLPAEVEELITEVAIGYKLPEPKYRTSENGLICELLGVEIQVHEPSRNPWVRHSEKFLNILTFSMSCYIPDDQVRRKIGLTTKRGLDGRVFSLEHNGYLDWFLELDLEGGMSGNDVKELIQRYIRVCLYAHRHSRTPDPSNWFYNVFG